MTGERGGGTVGCTRTTAREARRGSGSGPGSGPRVGHDSGAAFEEALRHYEAAHQIGEVAAPVERAAMLFELGRARRSTGSWDTAIEAWRQAVDAYEEAGEREGVGRVCAAASYMLLWASRFAESEELGRRGIAALGEVVSPDRGRLLGGTGMTTGYAGDHQAAAEMIDQELAIATALCGRRYDRAEAHFLRALEQAEAIPHRPEQAHTRRWYGRMLLDRGGPDDRHQGEEILRAATRDYQRMGMPRHAELARAALG